MDPDQLATVEATLLPINDFAKWVESHSGQTDDARRFSSLSARAAWCDAYFSARAISGASHDQAIKLADAARKRVRKALGYSYP